VGVSLLVIALDNTILNVALPSISTGLGASSSDLQWIVDGYVLVFAALLLTMGSFGDRVGRKRTLQAGVAWFGVGSLIAALAGSTEVLIGARAFLGFGAAIIMPSTLSIITSTFRDPKERSLAIALWAAIFGLGIGIGPVLGGWLLERYEWNSVFLINIPVAIVALIGGYFYISESRDEDAPRPDIPGVLLSITGLFALLYGIIEAGQDSWTAGNVVVGLGVGIVLLSIFVWWESHADNAMLPVRFFRNMSFTGASLAISMVMFGLFGSMFFMSQYFQSVLGFTALETGIRLLPIAGTMVVISPMSAQIAARFGIKFTVGLGILLAALGMLYYSQVAEVDTSYGTIVPSLIVVSAGMAMAMSPATDSIMGAVPVNKAGVGSAMSDTTRELGGALGVAILGTVMNSAYLSKIDALIASPALQSAPADALKAIESSIQGAHAVAAGFPVPEVGTLIVNTANEAFTKGMTDAMTIGAIIMMAAAAYVFAFLPSKIRRADAADVEVEERIAPALDTSEFAPALGD
jgi:EmrB/QacA subfamily drug resistance transporter